MNVFNQMPSMPDMGMVWMGAQQASSDIPLGLVPPDTSEMLLDNHENIYYTPSNHSMSSPSMDDIHSGVQSSHMDTGESYDMMHFMDLKQDSNDSSYPDDDGSQPVYMITTATQTPPLNPPTRKIKPVKHPGLILKTPIAYQSNTDPSVIPIQKDGIAVCENCGAIGVKHAFYTRERRFCSMACARTYNGLYPERVQEGADSKPLYAKYGFSMKYEDDFSDCYIDSKLPQLEKLSPAIDDCVPLIRRKPSELAHSFSWDSQLSNRYFVAAPVTCFKHAPMADIWENIMVGMKVEVENTDCENVSDTFPDSFWVATVMRIVGYKAQLRYEGFGANDSKDFWVSLCSNQVHPVGWCATRGKPLIPPKTIEDKYSDWKDFLRKRLTGARTLPSNFSNKASESLKSRFDVGLTLEVVDKNHISQVKMAVIHKIIGKRLNVKYFDMPPDDGGFWCHEDSPLLHPVGWARRVGHRLVAPINYIERISQGIFDEDDATDNLFVPIQVGSSDYNSSCFTAGMKLEAIDPLNLSTICVATVAEVLNHGYIMVTIDKYETEDRGPDSFCYHIKSPCIFPVGFCHKHNISLSPPNGFSQVSFDWNSYLLQTGKVPADPSLFNTYVPLHGFVPGMKIEAADLMDPRLICIATVSKVVGRLLKVHFDGWEDEFDQWLDCESPDIYPVGWCQSVGYKLEGPPVQNKPAAVATKSPKVKRRAGRKKKNKDSSKTSSLGSSSSISLSAKAPKVNQIATEEMLPDAELDDQSISMDLKSEISDDIQEICTNIRGASPIQDSRLENETSEEPQIMSNAPIPTNQQPVETIEDFKFIPRLIDSGNGSNDMPSGDLCPKDWTESDVAQFLRVNDCANYCDAFTNQKVTGTLMLELTKEDIIKYTGGKVGPSLKIYDLIHQLKMKVNSAQLRHMNIKSSAKRIL